MQLYVFCKALNTVCGGGLRKSLNASKPCEHPPDRAGGDKNDNFGWDHRLLYKLNNLPQNTQPPQHMGARTTGDMILI